MKKTLSLILAIMMLVSTIPVAYATTDVSNGTQVEYDAAADDTIGDSNNDGSPDNVEYYTVTVPALLAPGGSGDVTAKGTWASNRKLNVTADATVTLANTISGADEKVLDVTFPGIALVGSNTAAVTDTKVVSVANISAALFGTWEGVFEYNVEMVDNVELITFTFVCNKTTRTYQAEKGMTWKDWCNSEYNVDEWSAGESMMWALYPDDIAEMVLRNISTEDEIEATEYTIRVEYDDVCYCETPNDDGSGQCLNCYQWIM